MILDGYITDKNRLPIEKTAVEIKDDHFLTVYSTESNAEGYYRFDIPGNRYPFMTAVKDYAVNYLEYWCQNIPLHCNISIDIVIDKLEVYGLHVFSVKGAGNGLMVYFRPMDLKKYLCGAPDISPDNISVKATIDGSVYPVVAVNKVKESAAGREMTAYLIQVKTEESDTSWHRFDIEITDSDGQYGSASIFNSCAHLCWSGEGI